MSIERNFGNFFKAEIKTSGFKLYTQEKVSVTSGTDTAIHAYVKATPLVKVRFLSSDISSETFSAECSCPAGGKNQFCKHIWATLCSVEKTHPDFLDAKRNVEKVLPAQNDASEPHEAKAATAKNRAAAYRKEQYQKQKLRANELKGVKKQRAQSVPSRAYPAAVEAAMAYFALNGFPMDPAPSEAIVGEAKRKLSRVFHPDKGGSNEEIVELNNHSESILRFLRG